MRVNESLTMRILIVQSEKDLAIIWQRHLERLGAQVELAQTEMQAIARIEVETFDVIVLDVVLSEGSSLSVADVAYFRSPKAKVVFVTDTTFFSDGSIFNHSANACAYIRLSTPPQDLATIVHHYAEAANRDYAVSARPDGEVQESRSKGSQG